MEKKKKTTPKKKTAPKPAGKKSKKEEGSEIKRVAMEKRTTREEGSIAPPTQHLVDAFSILKRSTSLQRQAPAVTRLPARGPMPPPPPSRPPLAKPAIPTPTEPPKPQ